MKAIKKGIKNGLKIIKNMTLEKREFPWVCCCC